MNLDNNPEIIAFILLANLILLLTLFIFTLLNRLKINKISKKHNIFLKDIDNKTIEEQLEKYVLTVNEVKDKSTEFEKRLNHLERNLFECIQKVGIIRYNSFDNVSGDLSFVVALLNDSDTGVVINGVYSRDSSCTYAKAIVSGKSKHLLSVEEVQAIEQARRFRSERYYNTKLLE